MSKGDKFIQHDIERLKESVDLAALIGTRVALKRQGKEFAGLCPFHNESTPSFQVIPHKHFYHCKGCGAHGDSIRWLQETEKLSFVEAVEKLRGSPVMARTGFENASANPGSHLDDEAERRKKIEKARQIWNEAIPAFGTPVEKYLASRGLSGVMIPPALRFHPRCWNAEKSMTMPAMIGVVMARNQIVGVHRTYLKPDGSGKADVRVAKKMLGACQGGHIWLSSVTNGTLAVAEGIETALSVMKAKPGLAVWAAMSLNNMSAPLPSSVKNLILCADGDNKDMRAADAVLNRAAQAHLMPGRSIKIARPKAGMDFNDMVRLKNE